MAKSSVASSAKRPAQVIILGLLRQHVQTLAHSSAESTSTGVTSRDLCLVL